ncbi:MAG: hypothetical protein GY868_17725, partial [Deltaproteobacteria bacterium]|nr:hypothetical protein [Deltaproteobacteria bacterium]
EALGVPLPHFFETKGEGPQAAGTTRTYRPTKTELHPEAPLTDEERTLLKQFRKLSNPKIKQGLIKQLQGLIELERKL